MLLFEPDRHVYTYNGRELPSVTQVLSLLEDYSGISRDVLKRKALIGTAVHSACELYLAQDLDESSLHPEVRPYFEQFKIWIATCKFNFQLSEKRVFSKRFGYAGTLDLHGDFQGCPSLIDIKTAAVVMPTWGPQTAAYAEALREETGITTEKRFALQLTKTGHKLIPLENNADINVFYAALTVTQWRIRHGKHAA